ncbi:glycosyl transferase, group 1 domain containing protein, putative [Eimeria mitis]|uniref:Alpha-1,3/1,6-mannosyltransferase ALG2 n=1 Tax=Eimeria mitis TaxID=44415 RepID=U6JPP2_9EIME|nr:glycosyl transferase, group 1 domain containing protein, putative [Eimeria mitis]CDJ27480.1 glycosyl transferase, group 1 domain containing protein, putative [Eimeria mitis]
MEVTTAILHGRTMQTLMLNSVFEEFKLINNMFLVTVDMNFKTEGEGKPRELYCGLILMERPVPTSKGGEFGFVTALQTHRVFVDSRRSPCTVDIFTSYFDKHRCLESSRDPRLNIRVFGSFLPHAILGRFRVVCSILRMLYLILAAIFTGHMGYDLVFNDQVAVVNPLLRLIGMCDMVLVNSKFTAETFCQTFPSFRCEQPDYGFAAHPSEAFECVVNDKKAKPRVLYPPVSTEVEAFQLHGGSDNSDATFSELEGFDLSVPFATSLNRFEEKKNVELAIRAVASLPRRIKCNLIVAGGFDPRLPECNKYLQRLVKLSKELNFCVHGCDDGVDANASVTHNSEGRCILFLKNVPCEAMFVGTLPVACNTGGPRETIVDGGTGFLCAPTPESFSAALERIVLLSVQNPEELAAMRSKAQAHAANCFSPDVFRRSLQAVIEDVTGNWDDNSLGHLKKG